MSYLHRSRARAGFELIVDMDSYDDLDWWEDGQRGDMDFWTDYEYKRLHIIIHFNDLIGL